MGRIERRLDELGLSLPQPLTAPPGLHHDVAGATPAFLKTLPPSRELRGTDVEFGSGDEQCPLLVIGQMLTEELRAAELTGMNLRPVAPLR